MMYRRKSIEFVLEDLTERERLVLVPYVVDELRARVGRKKAIRAAAVAKILRADHREKTTTPRVRKMVNYIRRHGLLPDVIEGYTGYYVAMDAAELKRFLASLDAHADAIKQITRGLSTNTTHRGVQQSWM